MSCLDLLDPMSFRDWVEVLFGKAKADDQWLDATVPTPNVSQDERELDCLTYLFRHAELLGKSFSLRQCLGGLDLVLHQDIKHVMDLATLPPEKQLLCIWAQEDVFRHIFSRLPRRFLRCKNRSASWRTCLGWWDAALPYSGGTHAHWEAHVDVMERVLELDHDMCRIAAISGLCYVYYPRDRARRIYDDFMQRNSRCLSAELHAACVDLAPPGEAGLTT